MAAGEGCTPLCSYVAVTSHYLHLYAFVLSMFFILEYCTKYGKLILAKIIKIVATRCQILRLKCTKFDFGWGSAPDLAGGACSTPQTGCPQKNPSRLPGSRINTGSCCSTNLLRQYNLLYKPCQS